MDKASIEKLIGHEKTGPPLSGKDSGTSTDKRNDGNSDSTYSGDRMSTATITRNASVTRQEIECFMARASQSVIKAMESTGAAHDLIRLEAKLSVEADANNILQSALKQIQHHDNAEMVMQHFTDLHSLFKISQMKNGRLMEENKELMNTVETLETRLSSAPRILNVLKIAERYRKERSSGANKMMNLETENFDMSHEIRSLEEMNKNKHRLIKRLQEECVKIKELEKRCEYLEGVIVKKDNEINSLNEKLNPKIFEEKCKKRTEDVVADLTREKVKRKAAESDFTNRIQKLHGEKAELMAEVQNKEKNVERLKKTIRDKTRAMKEAEKVNKHSRKALQAVRTKNNEVFAVLKKMRHDKGRLLGKITNLEMLVGKGMDSANRCKLQSGNLSNELKRERLQNALCRRQLRHSKQALKIVTKSLLTLKENQSQLRAEHTQLQKSLIEIQAHLTNKQRELSSANNQNRKLTDANKNFECIMRMLYNNAMALNKAILGLQNENTSHVRKELDLNMQKDAIRALLNQVVEQFHECENQKKVIDIENKRNISHIKRKEQEKAETQRKMTQLTKANINFHNTTISQAEIEVMLRNQFEQMKKECAGLHSIEVEQSKKIDALHELDESRLLTIQNLNAKIKSLENTIYAMKMKMQVMRNHNNTVTHNLDMANNHLKKSERETAMLRVQRDLFGSKLLQGKTELAIVNERQKVSEITIRKANLSYQNIKNDLFILKLEIQNLRRKLKISEDKCVFTEQLKKELCRANREMQLEKNKLSAVEHQPPYHEHRWRNLYIRDKSRYELILKVQKLTRMLVKKTCEVTEKDMLIRQKDSLYLELNVLLTRRGNPSISAEMNLAKATIRKQNKQLKAITAELNMKTDDLSRAQKEVADQNRKISDSKKENLLRQRRELLRDKKKENERVQDKIQPLRLPPIHLTTFSTRASYHRPTLPPHFRTKGSGN